MVTTAKAGKASRSRSAAPARSEASFHDRMPALDGIRGLALIQVLLIHFAFVDGLTGGTALDRFISEVIESGWIAMDSFFVLSGFLITGILYDAKTAHVQRYYRNFYVRRSLRIFPAHYAFLFFLVLLLPLLEPNLTNANATISRDWGWFAGYAGNFRVALDHGHRADFLFTSHLWSLSVEEQFYVIWPIFVLLLSRQHLMKFCLAAVATAFITRFVMVSADVNHWWTYALMFTRMDSLAIGAILALALRDPKDLAALKRWLPRLTVVAAALITVPALIAGQLDLWASWSLVVDHSAVSVVYAFMIFIAATTPAHAGLNRILGRGFLVTLGRYSYSMYLVSVPLASLLFRHFDIGGAVPTIFGSHLPGQIAFAAVAFCLTFAIGWLSWHLLEGPALSLKRLFPYTAGADAARHTAGQPSAPAPALAGGD